MKHSSYVWRALLDLFVILPLFLLAVLAGGAFLLSTVEEWLSNGFAISLFYLALGLFLIGCGWRGARFAWQHQVDYMGKGVWVRYRPVIIAFAYTLSIAFVASLLALPEKGAVFGRFNTVFGFFHFFTSAPIAVVSIFGSAPPWYYLSIPLAITTAYWLGMAYGFWSLGSTRRDWVLSGTFAALFLLIGAGVAWRLIEIRQMVLPPVWGNAFEDRAELDAYRPGQEGNRLVNVVSPGLKISDNHPQMDGSTAVFPIYAAAAQAIYTPSAEGYNVDHLIISSKTPNAYKNLIEGKVDLIMVTPPSPSQRAAAEAAGVKLTLVPVAREAFVFFVHKDNPVTGLTTEQIKAIYQKKISNWKDAGGNFQPILPFQRPDGSGSQTAFLGKVMQGDAPASPLKGERIVGMGGIVRETAAYRNSTKAIGYSFRYYLTTMDGNPDVKMLAIDGVEPTRENIRNGTYPYITEIYLVTAGSENLHVQPLVDWFLSPKGQALIEAVGYVGVK